MQTALETAGYEVQTAAEGAEALELQRSRPADLLITDIFKPGGEGIETIGRFKAQFPGTKSIAMSAGIIPGMKQRLPRQHGARRRRRHPAQAVLQNQLLDTVRRVLRP